MEYKPLEPDCIPTKVTTIHPSILRDSLRHTMYDVETSDKGFNYVPKPVSLGINKIN